MNLPSLFRNDDDFWSFDPFTRMSQLQREMDRTFLDMQKEAGVSANGGRWLSVPSCDVQTAEGHYIVSMDLPGVKKEDIKIELSGNQLTISGERHGEKEEKKKGTSRSERFYGSFARTFTLPDDVKASDVTTEYKDGVLRLAIPAAEAAPPTQIKIGEPKAGFFERLLKKDQKTIEVKDSHKVA